MNTAANAVAGGDKMTNLTHRNLLKLHGRHRCLRPAASLNGGDGAPETTTSVSSAWQTGEDGKGSRHLVQKTSQWQRKSWRRRRLRGT